VARAVTGDRRRGRVALRAPAAAAPTTATAPARPATADRPRPRAIDAAVLHTDDRADAIARDYVARAVTIGRDIYFAAGAYDPASLAGQRLLAHELTHVDQYLRGDLAHRADGLVDRDDPLELEARAAELDARDELGLDPMPTSDAAAAPRGPALGTPFDISSFIGHDVELQGRTSLNDARDAGVLRAAMAMYGVDVSFRVKFGTWAHGRLAISLDADGQFTTTRPIELYAHHPQLPEVANQVLAVEVSRGALDVALGVKTPPPVGVTSISADPRTLADWRTSYIQPLLRLRDFASAVEPTAGLVDRLDAAGNFELTTGNYAVELPGPGDSRHPGTASLSLRNDAGTVTGEGTITAPGLGSASLVLSHRIGGDAGFFGTASISVGPFGAIGSRRGFTGNLTATFGRGVLDITGVATYDGPKLSGSATLRLTDAATAWRDVEPHIQRAVGMIPASTAPRTGMALTGWGHLTFELGPWLSGRAAVVVAPDGHIYSRGEIRPTGIIEVMRARHWTRSWGPWSAEVPLFDVVAGSIWAGGSVGFNVTTQFGPIQITDLRLVGAFSSNGAVPWQLEIGGRLGLTASADLTLTVTGTISARAFEVIDVLTAEIDASGTAHLYAGIDTDVAIGRRLRTPGDSASAEYFLSGVVSAHAGLAARFTADVNVSAIAGIFDWNVIHLASREYPIGERRLERRFDYVLGAAPEGNISVVPDRIDADAVLDAMVDNRVPQDAPGDDSASVDGTYADNLTTTTAPYRDTHRVPDVAIEPDLPSLDPYEIPAPVPPSSGGASAGVGGGTMDSGTGGADAGPGEHGSHPGYDPMDAGVPPIAGVPMPPPDPTVVYPDPPPRTRTERDDETLTTRFSMQGTAHVLRLVPAQPPLLIMESAPDDLVDKLDATEAREAAAGDTQEVAALDALEVQAAEVLESAAELGLGDQPNVTVPELEPMGQSLERFGTQYAESDLVTPGPAAATEDFDPDVHDPATDPVPDNVLELPWDDFLAHVRGLPLEQAAELLDRQERYLQAEIIERNRLLETIPRWDPQHTAVERDRTRLVGRLRETFAEIRRNQWQRNPTNRVGLPCFPAGTLVHGPDGAIAIERLVTGAVVWTVEPITGARRRGRVAAVTINRAVSLCDVELTGGERVAATADHPFWSATEQRWIPAAELAPGTALHGLDGHDRAVLAVAVRDVAATATYNLVLDGDPTYFVGPGVLVHNGSYALWHTYPWPANFKIYIGLNPFMLDKCYVGQTEQSILTRQNQHRRKAVTELARLPASDPQRDFYTFTRGMTLTAIAIGLRDEHMADYLEQKNINEERQSRNNRALVLNRRDELSRANYLLREASLRADADVLSHGYCGPAAAGP
jgi:hypothetical protein